MNHSFKKIVPDLVAILFFALLSCLYFYPADTEGRRLWQHDTAAGQGAGQEALEYYQRTGERTRWTNALFSGMPTYQMTPSYDSSDSLKGIEHLYRLFLPDVVGLVFIMLLGFYILLRAFDFKVWMSALGAIVWAFSSYFFIIIAAGHLWKFITLAYIPPTIAGMVLIYRGKSLWGCLVTTLFVALQILSNHLQMSYYFLFVMAFMAIAFGVEAWKKGELKRFGRQTLLLVLSAFVGVAINASNLYHTYQYSKESMRGKSELVKADTDTANQTKSGLERDYITQWSYGIGETFSLLVPNVKGGASNAGDKPLLMSDSETAMKVADPTYTSIYSQITQYWGEQPGTSGPVYVGAFVLMLFLLGLFIVKGPMKWALLAATLLSFFLSWGKNFMGFTDFFLDYIPLYDKFRAVSSILVIAEFTIPLLALLALREVVRAPQSVTEKRWVLPTAYLLTGGLALLFALAPKFFFPSYISSAEMNAFQQSGLGEHLLPILTNLEEMRIAIFKADAWRSFLIVTVGALFLWLYLKGRLKAVWMVSVLTLLCLVDLWQINKRYLFDEMFVEPQSGEQRFVESETDRYILQDTAQDYRVLNLAANTFNENETSYRHKSIGGYHAAKLRRYQELIEAHIAPEMQQLAQEVVEQQGNLEAVDGSKYPVLNMLNTRWLIFPLSQGHTLPLEYPYALGNAWFVRNLEWVANANEELESLQQLNPAETAVADQRFKRMLQAPAATDSTDVQTIRLTKYQPNELTYTVESTKPGLVVFSEIYYPGWRAFLDGEEITLGRVDWTLRAANVTAGKHQLQLTFHPVSIQRTETVAWMGLALWLVGVLIALWLTVRRHFFKKERTTNQA
jgi:hypothetical protein